MIVTKPGSYGRLLRSNKSLASTLPVCAMLPITILIWRPIKRLAGTCLVCAMLPIIEVLQRPVKKLVSKFLVSAMLDIGHISKYLDHDSS